MKMICTKKLVLLLTFLLCSMMLFFTFQSQIDTLFQSDSEDLVVGSMVYGARERERTARRHSV